MTAKPEIRSASATHEDTLNFLRERREEKEAMGFEYNRGPPTTTDFEYKRRPSPAKL